MEVKIISKLKLIELKKLHIRYIPVATPPLWNNDMSLKNSPHVELLRLIIKYGWDWKKLSKSRYWKERKRRYICGVKRWTEEYIKEHIKKRWKLYKSLKKRGFKKKRRGDRPIVVLKKPFWTTRFGLKEDWVKGWELWDGAGCCAAAYVLGWKTIPGVFAEDLFPGTGKKGKFKKKLRMFEEVWK